MLFLIEKDSRRRSQEKITKLYSILSLSCKIGKEEDSSIISVSHRYFGVQESNSVILHKTISTDEIKRLEEIS